MQIWGNFCTEIFPYGIKLTEKEQSVNEPRHEKTNVLHMRKQRRRSASR